MLPNIPFVSDARGVKNGVEMRKEEIVAILPSSGDLMSEFTGFFGETVLGLCKMKSARVFHATWEKELGRYSVQVGMEFEEVVLPDSALRIKDASFIEEIKKAIVV